MEKRLKSKFFYVLSIIIIVELADLTIFFSGLNWYQFKPGRLKWLEQREYLCYGLLLITGILVIWVLGLYAPGSGDFIYFQF